MQTAVPVMLIIVGLGMIGFWAMHIFSGKMTEGIKTLENGGFIGFHISAEVITGLLCIISGIAMLANAVIGYPLALFSCGMLAYTSLNSLAWNEVRNKPAFSLMFVIPLIIAIISAVYLIGVFLS